MLLSASQAAIQVGKSIPTITRAIKKGKISATKIEGGGYQIDPSELFRVFPEKKNVTVTKTVTSPKMLGSETLQELNTLRAKLEAKDEIMSMKDEMFQDAKYRIEDLERQRDKWQEEAKANRLILEDHRTKAEIKQQGFIARLFRQG
ncbi:MAG: hypothetical protein OFPII_43420 [Osedax symbiont Rs1]|nr:MAG: hypothetical protein OFPII_43300 [Osedax symbiont Rs1]EPJ43172.1 MAG: hypothetical protein OFPII_43420 [Osedax symbiont Rs1]